MFGNSMLIGQPGLVGGAKLLLDASDLNTITASGGNTTKWSDKSGNGYDFNASSTARPTTGSNTKNSRNVLTFDGTANTLTGPSGLYGISAGPNTLFTVAATADASVSQRIICGSISGLGQFSMGHNSPDNYSFINNSLAVGVDKAGNTLTNYNIAAATRSGTSRSLAINNGTAATNTTASDGTATEFFIGSRNAAFNFYKGNIAEIVLYDRLLSAIEILRIVKYLSMKWGITIS